MQNLAYTFWDYIILAALVAPAYVLAKISEGAAWVADRMIDLAARQTFRWLTINR